MTNKIKLIDDIKLRLRDINWFAKNKTHETIRHKIKIGYRTPKNHEFVPDQRLLGRHYAIINPETFVVEDVMHCGEAMGDLLESRPVFIPLSKEHQEKVQFKPNELFWIYNPEEKDFFRAEVIEND
jgi:hypothetical protein